MKIAILVGSLRKDSLNLKLARWVEAALKLNGHDADLIPIKEFGLPVYDGDIEESSFPPKAEELAQRIGASDQLIIVSPEYNGGIAGPLKNTLDWISRTDANPLSGRRVLLAAASPGALGGIRGMMHAVQTLMTLGMSVHPQYFSVAKADQMIEESGGTVDLKDMKLKERGLSLLKAWIGA